MPSKNQKKAKRAATATPAGPVPVPPENFVKIVTDMCADLSLTFPEYASTWARWQKDTLAGLAPEAHTQEIQALFEYCLTVFPERFFDILYKNTDIFAPENPIPTQFLPGVEFKALYNCEGVSDATRNVMWNYLQLLLFTILGSVQDKTKFGPTGNLFDGIDEQDLFAKLSETMQNMTDFFQQAATTDPDTEASTPPTGEASTGAAGPKMDIPLPPQMPDIKSLHEHLKGLFDGKIGALAKELAEEITGDLSSLLGEDAAQVKSTQDVLKLLMKNPAKISGLIKTIGDKLKTKINSGDVSHEELMKEATELLGKMKDMGGGAGGGMDQFKEMFKNMGVPIPKGARVDMNAVNQMASQLSMRERLKKRMMEKKAGQMAQAAALAAQAAERERQASLAPQSLQELSAQYGLDLESNEGIATGAASKKKKGKK
jgi:hypothetical protein